MRLSEWRAAAPKEGVLDDAVAAVIGPILADLGAEPDPECWVAWGDEPQTRYSLLAPTMTGLITMAVRFTTQEDGPRVIAKLVRWSKVAVSELSIDAGGGHRMVAVQVENQVLKGMDEEADRICRFVRIVIAGVDDRLQAFGQGGVTGFVQIAQSAAGPAAPVGVQPAAVVTAGTPGGSIEGKATKAPKGGPAPMKKIELPPGEVAAEAVPKVAHKAAKSNAGPVGVPAQPVVDAPQATSPTPIAARAAARQGPAGSRPAPDKPPIGAPAPEPDRSEWVSPHAIQQPAPVAKPRNWMP
jgi:hypothetical protein